MAGAEVVVLANDHPSLGAPGLLDGCAPGAVVYDLCGVLADAARADLTVRRLGAGGGAAPEGPAGIARRG